jgi:hypothetical protein
VEHEEIRARRRLQKTGQWQRHYATRLGVESTIAQGIRRCGPHRSRCIALNKTRFNTSSPLPLSTSSEPMPD